MNLENNFEKILSEPELVPEKAGQEETAAPIKKPEHKTLTKTLDVYYDHPAFMAKITN